MAENKLSWSELRRAIAKRAGVSEKVAGTFLNSFATQLIEALKQDKQVKINGLGTFKLQSVAPRKSVNVTTGEEIIIEGYNKVVFAPEAGLKELVEKTDVISEQGPSDEEKVEVIDPLKKLGAQAEEIVGILAEIDGMEEEKTVVEEPVEEEQVEQEQVEEEPLPEPEPIVEPEPEPEPIVEPIVEPEPIVKDKPKKKYHFLRDTLICVVVLLMLLLCGYFFLRSQIGNWIDSLLQNPQQTEIVVTNDTIPEPVIEEPVTEEPVIEETISEEPVIEVEPYSELLTTEYITRGSRLTWIAKKHYGSKIYWPYLYDANKAEIPNPSRIPVGTPVKVPKLTADQLDTIGAENRARLDKLRLEAEEACRR